MDGIPVNALGWMRYTLGGVALCAAAFFVLGLSALAAGTPAGSSIPNTANATYTDPLTPGTPLTTTSNTITIRVGEVAGITVVPLAVGAVGGGVIVPGGAVNFDFTLRNTGNWPNYISIPNTATLTGTAGATISGSLQISYDGVTFVPLTAAAGTVTGSGSSARLQTTQIPVDGTVIVRVVAAVPAGATQSSTINVILGNTGSNDNGATTQNEPYSAGHTNNVATLNGNGVLDTTTPGPPLNGRREASGLSITSVQARPQAFAQLLKAGGAANLAVNPQSDTIQYSLTLNVLASYPSAGPAYIAAPLIATAMQLDGVAAQRVLISDVIPVNTVLTSVGAAPSGWTIVYSTVTTAIATSSNFTTAPPASLATVKRIGWIAPGPIPLGSSTPGFNFLVTATGALLTGQTTVLNIGQVYGGSQGDLTNLVVYDQSGDQTPSNFSTGDGSPGSSHPLATAPATGVPPTSGPNDPGANTGVAGGDNNVVILNPQASLVNGPMNVPGALGPDGTNNTDVTMQSVNVPGGLSPTAGLQGPLASTFTNTVGNPGTIPLTNVTLVPQTPAVATSIPNGATFAISWTGQTTPAVYTYSASGWTLTSGTPVSIPSIPAAGSQSYTVVITLPAGTQQSTNGGVAAGGFGAPILATSVTPFGTSTNTTIDTVFTGFIKLAKLAQVFNADGTPCDAAPSAAPTPSCVVPGNIVEYTIQYTNIAPIVPATGSVTLSASRMAITEDGQAAPNTFAIALNGVLVTSAMQGSATDSTTGNTITYFNAVGQNVGDIAGSGTATADVTKYIDTFAAPLTAGKTGTLVFRRKIN